MDCFTLTKRIPVAPILYLQNTAVSKKKHSLTLGNRETLAESENFSPATAPGNSLLGSLERREI